MQKKVLIALVSIALTGFTNGISASSDATEQMHTPVLEHSGRTDKNGCHRDRKNGGRHCH